MEGSLVEDEKIEGMKNLIRNGRDILNGEDEDEKMMWKM